MDDKPTISVEHGRVVDLPEYLQCIPEEWGGLQNGSAIASISQGVLQSHMLVAFVNRSVAGLLVWTPDSYVNAITIGPVVIKKQFRKLGVASGLLQAIEIIANRNGIQRMFLDSLSSDKSADFVFGSLKNRGYELCGSVKHMIQEGAESYIYSKLLSNKSK